MLFESGKDTVNAAGANVLKRIGTVLKDFPAKSVQVDGHTDNVAIRGALLKKFPNNQALSKSRAVNVLGILRQGGVAEARLESTGYADTKPVASNDTEAGRQKNRRVESCCRNCAPSRPMLSKVQQDEKDHAMDANSTMIGTGSTGQTDSKNEGTPRIMAWEIQPAPTIRPEQIGCVMMDVQAQIDGLQLYLIELGSAKTRVTLLREKGWGHGDRNSL